MRTHRGRASTLLLTTLAGLAACVTPAWGQGQNIRLGTLPGLTPSQASVGTAVDVFCPQLPVNPVNPAQQDLQQRCGQMKDGSLGSQLADALGKVTSEQTTTQGTGSIETRTTQFRAIGPRLAALRLGTTGLSLGRLNPDSDPKTASTASLDLDQTGGGASADRNFGGPLGAFVNGVGSFGSKDSTTREVGFDFHSVGATAGVDYRFTDRLVAGLAFSYLRTDADITFGLGQVDSTSYGLSFYGTHYAGPAYIDVLGGFTRYDYDTTRRIVYGSGSTAVDRTAKGDTNGRQYAFNVGAGYEFRHQALTATPYGRVELLHLDIDGYTESGANGLDLQVKKQTVESLLMVLGGRLAYALSTPFGVLLPQVRGEWRHEALNDGRAIKAQFVNDPFNTVFSIPTDKPDRDYFAMGAGISSVFTKGVAAFLDFETLLGLQGVTNHNVTAGVRIEF